MISETIPNARTIVRQPWPVIVLVALAVRLARILIVHSYIIPLTHVPPPMSVGDPHFTFGYEIGSIAHSIATGHGFGSPFGPITGPTTWIAPIYPYLCAAVFKLFGVFTPASAFVMLSLNSVFAALTCIPLFRICVRLMSPAAGLWAAWAWALVPYFWSWPTSEIWETSLVALLLAFLVLMTLELGDAASLRDKNKWLKFGLVWGIALLTNPVALTFLPVSFIWLGYHLWKERPLALRRAVLTLVTCALVVAPWLTRNRVVFGQFVFIRSNFGFEFHLGNYHLSNGFGWAGKHPSANRMERDEYARIGEIGYVVAKRAVALKFVHQYPSEFLELTARRVSAFWSGAMMAYGSAPLQPWLYAPFSLLTFFGWLLAARDKRSGQGLLLGLLLFYPSPFYLAFPQARNRHAIEPEMLVFCVYFVIALMTRIRLKEEGRAQREEPLEVEAPSLTHELLQR